MYPQAANPDTIPPLLSLLHLHLQYPSAPHLQVREILSVYNVLNAIISGQPNFNTRGIMGVALRAVSDQIEMWQRRGRRGERVERVLQEFVDIIETFTKYEEDGGTLFEVEPDWPGESAGDFTVAELPDNATVGQNSCAERGLTPPSGVRAHETQRYRTPENSNIYTKDEDLSCRITHIPYDDGISELYRSTPDVPSSPVPVFHGPVFSSPYRAHSVSVPDEFLGDSIRVDEFFDLLHSRLTLFSDVPVHNSSIIRFRHARPGARPFHNASSSLSDFITTIVEELSVQAATERSQSPSSTTLPQSQSPLSDCAGQIKLEYSKYRSSPGASGWYIPPTPRPTSALDEDEWEAFTDISSGGTIWMPTTAGGGEDDAEIGAREKGGGVEEHIDSWSWVSSGLALQSPSSPSLDGQNGERGSESRPKESIPQELKKKRKRLSNENLGSPHDSKPATTLKPSPAPSANGKNEEEDGQHGLEEPNLKPNQRSPEPDNKRKRLSEDNEPEPSHDPRPVTKKFRRSVRLAARKGTE